MKKKENKITVRNVFFETKASHFGFSSQLLYFSLFTLLSLMLAYVLPLTLIITFPLVIVPSYFSFTSVNAIKGKKNSEFIGFFTMFKTYFSSLFFGGYRLIAGFFKSLLIYLLSNTLIITILDFTVLMKSSEFQELMKTLENNTDATSLNEAVNSFTNGVLNSPEIQKWVYLAMAISSVIATFVYIQHIAKHSIKMRRNLFTKQVIPARQFSFVDRRVRRDNRKFLISTYLRTCWFIQILIVLAGAGGVVGSFFLLAEFGSEQAFIISLFLMFLVTLPFLNYISKLQDMLYISLAKRYEETFATLALEFLSKYKEKIGIAEEEAKKIEELLNAQKQSNKEEEKTEEDNNDTDQK